MVKFNLLRFLIIFISTVSIVSAQETFRDNFSSVSYSNNDGTQNFSTDWIENGADTNNGPTAQYIRINSNVLLFQYLFGENIRRTADLSGATTATLTFDWQTVNLTGGQALTVQMSNNGGASYTTIGSFTGSNTNSFSANISAYISSNTTIRFGYNGTNWDSNDAAAVDNLTITADISLSPNITIEDISIDEDAGNATFTVTHNDAATSGYNVDYSITGVSATEGVDYTTGSGLYTGTLSFNGSIGDTEQITVNLTDDNLAELNETYTIQFTSTTNGSIDITDTATGTITEPDNTRAYEERYAMNLAGNFKVISNTNIECVSGCPASPTTNNPSAVMGYADIDGDTNTDNSSSATLSIPAGATVAWAGLYWGGLYGSTNSGITNPTGLNSNEIKFKAPGSTNYTTLSASVINVENASFSGWTSYLAFTEVTSIVQAGGSGDYFSADIALATGSSFTGPYGGWNLVVVYEDATEISRNIAIWDGFEFFGFGANDTFTVTGLLTPSSGSFETHAAYFAFDGEANRTGDFVSIEGTALSNTLNPADNTLNGTISEFGVDNGLRNPNYAYSWGIDSDVFDASGLVANNATDMDVTLGSSSEGVWGGVFVTSNEIAFPTVANIEFSPTTVDVGEESTVTITVDNPTNGVSLTNFALTNNLPTGMTVSSSPDATSSCGGTITATPGNTSFSISGVSIPAGTSCSFTFDVVTNASGSFVNTISASDVSNDQNIPLSGADSATLNVNALADTDNDGEPDVTDLDDDNDGILDTIECGYSILWVLNNTAGPEEQNVIDKLIAMGHSVTVVDDNVGDNADNYDVTFLHEDVFSGTAAANVANFTTTTKGVITSEQALHDEILGGPGGGNANSTFIDILNNTHPITNNLSLGNYTIGDAGHFAGNLTSGTVLANHSNGNIAIAVWETGDAMETGNAPGRRAIVPHANDGAGLNTAGEDLLVRAILWAAGNTPLDCDFDSDGVINSLDLDSDNDGIYDAVESGHNQTQSSGRLTGAIGADGVPDSVQASGQEDSGTINYLIQDSDTDSEYDFIETDSDNDGCNDADEAYGDANADSDDNGTYGSGTPSVDSADGTVVAASYETPEDGNTNGTFDFQEVGAAPNISSQPSDTPVCPGCTTTLAVTATADTYQWQLFNGTTWDNLSDTGIYSGTETNTLTITNVTSSENNNRYRVITSNLAYICDNEISDEAVLSIQVNTVITNRRITYRVKKN